MRLFEQLQRETPSNNYFSTEARFPFDDFISDLRQSKYISIDNVAEYLSNKEMSWGFLENSDLFPNIAPPWEGAFYEFVSPVDKNVSIGVGIGSTEKEELPIGEIESLIKLAETGNKQKIQVEDVGWAMQTSVFFKYRNSSILMLSFYTIIASKDGEALGIILHDRIDRWEEFAFGLDRGLLMKISETLLLFKWNLPIVALTAISISHCKNVEVVTVTPDKRLSLAQFKRRGCPKLSYSIIDIKPMTRIIQSEGMLSSHGLMKKAFHICRGHFKDYRKRGLFGRSKGMYWWDMHTRGSKDQGIAKRDYKISL